MSAKPVSIVLEPGNPFGVRTLEVAESYDKILELLSIARRMKQARSMIEVTNRAGERIMLNAQWIAGMAEITPEEKIKKVDPNNVENSKKGAKNGKK